MLTQTQKFSITSLDELVISPSQFNDFMTEADSLDHPIGALYTSTVRILRHASWLAEQKAVLTKQEYKELLRKYNWEGEEKAHLKIHEAFGAFAPYQLAQIEPRTIFQIALNLKKYQLVITQMQTLPVISQDKVRSLMKQCRKPKAKKEEEAPTIWRMMPDGKRACVIAPIYNQSVGVILEEIVKKEGRTAQSIVEEALVAYYKSKYGSAVSEEATQEVSEEVAPITDLIVDNQKALAVEVVDGNETAPVVDVVEETAPAVDVVDGNQTAPVVDVVVENQTAPILTEVTNEALGYVSWDKDKVCTEDFNESETSFYSEECDEEVESEDGWSFEPEEKDDLIEDYEFVTSVDIQSKTPAPSTEEHQEQQSQNSVCQVLMTKIELAPVDLLIQALQTASSWQEISEALKTHEEYKQEAWDALTPVERKRIIELTPPTITKLSNAKREGLIAEFRVEREGVYHVRENGCFIWDIVFEYRVEEYLAKLVIQYCKS